MEHDQVSMKRNTARTYVSHILLVSAFLKIVREIFNVVRLFFFVVWDIETLYCFYSVTSSSLTVSSLEESIVNSEREHQPFIVLYMVDPFHAESKLNNYPGIWSYVGLMKCFLEMRNDLNDYLKENLLFEVLVLFSRFSSFYILDVNALTFNNLI